MANAHLPKPGLRSPAATPEKYPDGAPALAWLPRCEGKEERGEKSTMFPGQNPLPRGRIWTKPHWEIKKQMNWLSEQLFQAPFQMPLNSKLHQTHSCSITWMSCFSIETFHVARRFLAVGLVCTFLSDNTGRAMSPETFKDILANPAIMGLVSLEFAGGSQLADGNSNGVIETAYEFVWLEKNFKIKQTLSGQKLEKVALENEAGDFQGQSWEHSRHRIVFYEKDIQMINDSIGSRFIFKTLRSLGLQYLDSKSLVWNDNAFTAKVVVDYREFSISGEMVVDSIRNRVLGLNYRWNEGVFSYRINYYFEGAKEDARFPSRIVVYGYGATGDNPLMVFDNIHYGQNHAVVLTDLDPNILFHNSEKVRLSKDGLKASFIPAQVNQPSSKLDSKSRFVLMLIFAVSSSFIVWLILRLRTKPIKANTIQS